MYWNRVHRTEVRVTIGPERGNAAALVNAALNAKRRAGLEERSNKGAAWDDVWCVLDHETGPEFAEVVARAEAGGVRIAVSNPCIEFWLSLHSHDHEVRIERSRAQSRLRRELGCEAGFSDQVLEQLASQYDVARERATALDARHASSGRRRRSNPSSEMWKLVDQIRRTGSH